FDRGPATIAALGDGQHVVVVVDIVGVEVVRPFPLQRVLGPLDVVTAVVALKNPAQNGVGSSVKDGQLVEGVAVRVSIHPARRIAADLNLQYLEVSGGGASRHRSGGQAAVLVHANDDVQS